MHDSWKTSRATRQGKRGVEVEGVDQNEDSDSDTKVIQTEPD